MSICIVSAISVPEGDGVIVKRLMPLAGLRNFDPFVLWDHFDISGGGFPDHPHRGFEAVTYLFEGGMKHADNLGNQGKIHAGGVQRFTAGCGMVHSEFPDGRAHGIQLWINLPKRLKTIAPDYQQLQGDEILEREHGGITIRTIVGEGGAISLHTKVEYLDIKMDSGASYQGHVTPGLRGFVYVVEGAALINGLALDQGDAAFIDIVTEVVLDSTNGARLMWCFGQAHHEAIHQHGPFVD